MEQLQVVTDLMAEERFWAIIEASVAPMDDDPELQGTQEKALAQALRRLSWRENLEFANRFYEVHGRAYRQDLWCAAYLMCGGCSDDGFIDFRRWLISRGRDVYEAALANPDSLIDASHQDPDYDYYSFEDFGNYTVADVFEEMTGHEIYAYTAPGQRPLRLEFAWDQDDMESMAAICPKLAAKYGWS